MKRASPITRKRPTGPKRNRVRPAPWGTRTFMSFLDARFGTTFNSRMRWDSGEAGLVRHPSKEIITAETQRRRETEKPFLEFSASPRLGGESKSYRLPAPG